MDNPQARILMKIHKPSCNSTDYLEALSPLQITFSVICFIQAKKLLNMESSMSVI